MDGDSQRDGGWWLPKSRLNADDIDLEISLGWLSAKIRNFVVSVRSTVSYTHLTLPTILLV